MRLQWTEDAQKSMRKYIADQAGMNAVNVAIAALTDDPEPTEAFIRGRYHRLRVGPYRVLSR